VITELFEKLDISTDLVATGLSAMKSHSQNNMLYDPANTQSITQEKLDDCDKVMAWTKLPIDTKTEMDDYFFAMRL